MSSSVFKAMAWDHMSSGDAEMLDFCTLDPDPPRDTQGATEEGTTSKIRSDFIKRWKEWERALRQNLAKNRAQKLKREAGEAPDTPSDAVLAAKNALTFESPLDAEMFLDKARWDAIDNFQGINVFNESAMYAYLLKLLIMERRLLFDPEEGYNEYKGLYAAILGQKTDV
ncbi:MAG: DUF2764 domain-containing protein [Treponema sp.]|nr:DUF2764 domain-containing protein [Treponema sp.]